MSKDCIEISGFRCSGKFKEMSNEVLLWNSLVILYWFQMLF